MLIYLVNSGELLISNYENPSWYALHRIPCICGTWVYGYTNNLDYHSTVLAETFNLTKWTNEQTKLMKQAKFMEKL